MKQVTFAPRHHQLTNINTWTPDSQWLVFDVRPSGASFTGETIERVNVNSGTVETIYRATQGAHVGVVTVHPTQERYVFIHGPERPDAQWQYDFHHRRGVVAFQGAVENLDAMDITAPYTPGALRLAEASNLLQLLKSNTIAGLREYEVAKADPDRLSSMGFAVAMNNVKIASSETIMVIINQAMLICGIMGYKNGTPFSLGRHLRDAHSAQLMISNDRILGNTSNLLLVHKQDTSLIG